MSLADAGQEVTSLLQKKPIEVDDYLHLHSSCREIYCHHLICTCLDCGRREHMQVWGKHANSLQKSHFNRFKLKIFVLLCMDLLWILMISNEFKHEWCSVLFTKHLECLCFVCLGGLLAAQQCFSDFPQRYCWYPCETQRHTMLTCPLRTRTNWLSVRPNVHQP